MKLLIGGFMQYDLLFVFVNIVKMLSLVPTERGNSTDLLLELEKIHNSN